MFTSHSLLPRQCDSPKITAWALTMPAKETRELRAACNRLPVPHSALPYFTAVELDAVHAQARTGGKVIKNKCWNNRAWSCPHAVARKQGFVLFFKSRGEKLKFYFYHLPLSKYFVYPLTPPPIPAFIHFFPHLQALLRTSVFKKISYWWATRTN